MMTELLLQRLAKHGILRKKKVALTFLNKSSKGRGIIIEREMTYEDIVSGTDALAAHLLSKGLKKGDMAVLVYPPSLDFIVAFIACLKAGICAVPVFPPNPSRGESLRMFSKIVENCGAQYALTNGVYSHMRKLSVMKDSFTRARRTRSSDHWDDKLNWIVTDGVSSTKRVTDSVRDRWKIITLSDLAFLQYTSGSTNDPKGVIITHGNLSDNLTKITKEFKAQKDTVVVSWLPQYHDMGLIGSYLGILYCGGSGYYMSPLTFVQRPVLWVEAISRFRATHLQAPNFAFKLTARKFDATLYKPKGTENEVGTKNVLDMSSIQHICNAAEPVTEESIDTFLETFGPFGVKSDVMFPSYGLAEHTVFVCSGGRQRITVSKIDLENDGIVKEITSSSSKSTSRLIGCGFPYSQGVDVKIVKVETMQEVDEDTVGEIWIFSESKASGYYKKPIETKSEFCAQIRVPLIGSETGVERMFSNTTGGYLRTGDLGFLHNKELFICGRIKDLIIIRGRNYYPQDIEQTVESSMDSLRQGCSAAFTVGSISEGDLEVALVVELREEPKEKEAKEKCMTITNDIRAAVSHEHCLALKHIVLLRPRTVHKTTSGKIARSWCREAFLKKTIDSIYISSSIENRIHGLLKESVSTVEGEEISSSIDLVKDKKMEGKTIRTFDKKFVLQKLTEEISQIVSVPPESIDINMPLTTVMDSLNLFQFKGLLEIQYATHVSEEYLFSEKTTVNKLVEVVKLEFPPDFVQDIVPHFSENNITASHKCPARLACCILM